MSLEELLYWDTLSDLVFDDLGAWEVAWRANTLADETSDRTRGAAASVILRLVDEGLAVVVDGDTREALQRARLTEILSGDGWAAVQPTVMPIVAGTKKADERVRLIPEKAIELISRGR